MERRGVRLALNPALGGGGAEVVVRGLDTKDRHLHVPVPGTLRVGRDPDCEIVLYGPLVSRIHAIVELESDGLEVTDCSTNGTLVGTTRVRGESLRAPLPSQVQIAGFRLSFRRRSGQEDRQADGHEEGQKDGQKDGQREGQRDGQEDRRPQRDDATDPAGVGVARAAGQVAPEAGGRGPGPVVRSTGQEGLPAVRDAAEDRDADARLRRRAHALLLENLDLDAIAPSKEPDPSMRPRVLAALRKVVQSMDLPATIDRDTLVGELADEALGLGPLEQYLKDPTVSEIMVVDPHTIYVERMGTLSRVAARFTDDDRVRAVIERIVTPLGRRIDESSPFVDARLPDGSRVNAVIRPIALRGACITIRKFARTRITVDKLIAFGAMTPAMARFLRRSVIAKKNVVVAGGTGSGKTTLLNVLSEAIPEDERIVTIEDAAELQLSQPHVVALETRPPNMEGKGGHTVRDLVKNALRMRPDRIVVGECRGGEALDMLQAMNTGHDGSLTTTHANSPREALARLETLVLMAGLDLPSRAIREQIASAVHLVVQQTRFSDGSRRVTNISEVLGIDEQGQIAVVPLFEFVRTGTSEDGRVMGAFRPTGFLPSFLQDFILKGLVKPGEPYL